MITIDMQPVSIVKDSGFKGLVNVLDKRYATVPSHRAVTTSLHVWGAVCVKIQTEVGVTKTDQYLIFSVINDLKNIDIYQTDRYLLK